MSTYYDLYFMTYTLNYAGYRCRVLVIVSIEIMI